MTVCNHGQNSSMKHYTGVTGRHLYLINDSVSELERAEFRSCVPGICTFFKPSEKYPFFPAQFQWLAATAEF